MSTHIIRSRQEAEMALRSGCEEFIGYLRELQAVHLAMDGPERRPAECEAEEVLHLRKVYLHVQAVASWKVGKHVLHVVAPEIRAAQEQLYPLTLEHLYDNDEQEAANHRRQRNRVLDLLSHPTPMILIYSPTFGGLASDNVRDNVREFIELYLWLSELVNAYGLSLGVIAEILSYSPATEILDVVNRATVRLTSFSPEAFRPFMEEVKEEERIE